MAAKLLRFTFADLERSMWEYIEINEGSSTRVMIPKRNRKVWFNKIAKKGVVTFRDMTDLFRFYDYKKSIMESLEVFKIRNNTDKYYHMGKKLLFQ